MHTSMDMTSLFGTILAIILNYYVHCEESLNEASVASSSYPKSNQGLNGGFQNLSLRSCLKVGVPINK